MEVIIKYYFLEKDIIYLRWYSIAECDEDWKYTEEVKQEIAKGMNEQFGGKTVY